MALGLQRSWADLLIQENIVYLFGFVVFLGGIGGLIIFFSSVFVCLYLWSLKRNVCVGNKAANLKQPCAKSLNGLCSHDGPSTEWE